MRNRHTPPYDQTYRFTIDHEYSGKRLIDFYSERFDFKPREYWSHLIERGDITVNGQLAPQEFILKIDDVTHTIRRDVTEPDVNASYQIIHQKDGLFIVNKPSPLPVHASGRYFKNSLLSILREQYPGTTFHTIHRLDLWTTGVLLLATEPKIARHIHMQVENQSLKKCYAVLAIGKFGDQPFVVNVPIGRKNGVQRGFGEGITEARECVTEFTPLAHRDNITLLKAVPITGRTNQIRVHLQAAGGHVLHDPMYSTDPIPEEKMTFMGLHCREMRFKVLSGEAVSMTAPWPEGFLSVFPESQLTSLFKMD